jgi:fructose 5-dehydrogenase small subunit
MTKQTNDKGGNALLSRRGMLLGSAAMFAGGALASLAPQLAVAAVDTSVQDQFMKVSSLLIDHQLNPDVGNRIASFAAGQHQNLTQMLDAIITVAEKKQASIVEDFMDDLPEGELKEFAHWVILAWYSGCSSSKTDAEVFTFEQALTFKTTADVVTIPSFGLTGPNLWDAVPSASVADMPTF